MTLKVGDVAPDFTLPSDNNQSITLRQLQGKKIVLYFYPKDNTPGCTQQACAFRDTLAQFKAHNAEIYGVSKDSPEKHDKFKTKYQLPFALLADTTGDVCEAYGIINKKSLFGRTFLGIQRSTFLINEKGIIQAIWRKVKVKEHIQQVLDELNKG